MHVASLIQHFKELARQKGSKTKEPCFVTHEGRPYDVLFNHGETKSKFYGPGWEELVKDYAVRALEDLTENEMEYVDSCVYTRGVELGYDQLGYRSYVLFSDDYIASRPFVHSFRTTNVEGNGMLYFQKIPKLVVSSLKNWVVVPAKGNVTLEEDGEDVYVITPAKYYIAKDDRMVMNMGSKDFIAASSFEVDNKVLITFKERDGVLALIFSNLM